MADSFFGFDTSLSNLNDDEGGGEPSEDEYDALNDETFGQDDDEYDWEVQHEQLASQLESSRRNTSIDEDVKSQLEASLSQLVLDETDAPQSRTLGSSVWRHDPRSFPTPDNLVPPVKHVCTVEELERQLRQKQQPTQQFSSQNYYQPRFPAILQRPPGLQAPTPLSFGSQMTHMNQPLNKAVGQPNHINQMGQNNQLVSNQMGQHSQLIPNQMNQTNHHMSNQLGQNINQMGQNINQMSQNINQLGQNMNQLGQNMNQMGHNMNQVGQTMNQNQFISNHLGNQFGNQIGQNNVMNHMPQNTMNQNHAMSQNQMSQNFNQLGQNVNQLGQNVNQMNHKNSINQNQIMPNGNQFGPTVNQFPHMMGQPRMIGPPPGINMPRQNFNQSIGQFNQNFRGPIMPMKTEQQSINQLQINQPPPLNKPPPLNQPPPMNQPPPIIQQLPMNQQQSMNQQQTMNQQQIINQQMLQQQLQGQKQKSPSNQQLNTSPQNKQQTTNKAQKSRVYNNSSQQKNMTSQNLVQLIQNTHPMLQHNNSYHNASHHPMLNTRNNNFNNQFMNHQRQNGVYTNSNRTLSNGDDSSVSSEDEYAGLMTPREKQWLINIQILQLNTGTPYIHDFYYTVFLERQSMKDKESVKEAHKANQQNHPFYSGVNKESQLGRERHNSVRHNSTSEDTPPRTYVPTQFENSLGKLQCGSVTAPRKIIDVELVSAEPSSGRCSRAPSRASTANPAEVPREIKRTKQILLDIEALYTILLRLEELNDPLAISNALILKEREEKQRQIEAAQKELENEQEEDSNLFLRNIESVQRRPKQESPKSETVDKRQVVNLATNQKPTPVKNLLDEDKDELINKMFSSLLHADRLPQMLTVRKGRVLVCRFARRVPGSHPLLRALWARALRALPSAARRDDGSLAPLADHYHKYIQNTSGWSAILESCSLLAEALDPARTPYALTTAFTLTCATALIEKASPLVNTPEANSNERQWYKFLKTLARALKNTTLTVARPLKPMPEAKLIYHLKQLESRSTIEILQRGKTAEFGDLSKTDVSEQLLKYLC